MNDRAPVNSLDADVDEHASRRCTVPMHLAGSKPHAIARPNLFHLAALSLHKPYARDNVEYLAAWMGVPVTDAAGM